jgi:hypothetical protein
LGTRRCIVAVTVAVGVGLGAATVGTASSPPTLVITTPAENAHVSKRSVMLAGQATPGTGGPVTSVRVNGLAAHRATDGSWNATKTLHSGRNTFTVAAQDSHGTTVSAKRHVFYAPDCVVPSVVGRALSSAITLIHRKHCQVGAITHKSSSRPHHQVISQSPPAGTHRRQGSKVALTISG